MGRNTPSIKRKLDSIVNELKRISKFLRDETTKSALNEVINLIYTEAGALSASNNPIIYFDILLLLVANLWGQIKALNERVRGLEEILGADRDGGNNHQHENG